MEITRIRIRAVVIGALTLIASFVLLCMYNPMRLVFLTSFVVENDGPEPIRVAALGVAEGGGIEPLYELRSKALPLPISPRQILILPGQSASFFYNWDDINFCWLAIESPDGTVRLQETTLDRKGCSMTGERGPCCGSNPTEVYKVGDLQRLQPASRLHKKALLKATEPR